MNVLRIKILFLISLMIAFEPAKAQSENELVWKDGSKQRKIRIEKETKQVQVPVTSPNGSKSFKIKTETEISVFDSTGEKKFAGGVICYFKTKHSLEDYQAWTLKNNVKFAQLISSKAIMIEAPKDETSLTIANQLSESEDVKYCQPNWEQVEYEHRR